LTPPPLRRREATPPLMAAMLQDRPLAVKAVLALEPDAARDPFDGRLFQPPLCFAARMAFSQELPSIIDVLLEHGARPNNIDADGKTPLMCLCEALRFLRPQRGDKNCAVNWFEIKGLDAPVPVWPAMAPFAPLNAPSWMVMESPLAEFSSFKGPFADMDVLFKAATSLLLAGAELGMQDAEGQTAEDLARLAGSARFACFLRNYRGAQAMRVLSRATASANCLMRHSSIGRKNSAASVTRLSGGLIRNVCAFLLDPECEEAVHACMHLST